MTDENKEIVEDFSNREIYSMLRDLIEFQKKEIALLKKEVKNV